MLAQVADEAIQTMHEVIEIEREVAAGDREREAKLAAIRDAGHRHAGRERACGGAMSENAISTCRPPGCAASTSMPRAI